jgi:serine/threonine protein kinase
LTNSLNFNQPLTFFFFFFFFTLPQYDFPSPYWDEVSQGAKDLIQKLLVVDPKERLTAAQVLKDDWIRNASDSAVLSTTCVDYIYIYIYLPFLLLFEHPSLYQRFPNPTPICECFFCNFVTFFLQLFLSLWNSRRYETIRKFNARRKFKMGIIASISVNRMKRMASTHKGWSAAQSTKKQ